MKMRYIVLTGAGAVALGLVAGPAAATEDSSYCSYSNGSYGSNCGAAPQADSAAKTQGATTQQATVTLTNAVSSRVAAAFSPGRSSRRAQTPGETGLSAGDGAIQYSLWGAMGGTNTKSAVALAGYNGTIANQTMGMDATLDGNKVIGLTLFHDGTDLETDYNAGSLSSDGWSVVPYAAYSFGQGTTIDALAGMSYVTSKVKRAGANAEGDFGGYRLLAATNLRHTLTSGDWAFRADAGLSGAFARSDSYAEKGVAATAQAGSTSHLVESRLGGRVSYLWGQVEPFGQVSYAYSFVADGVGRDTYDKDDITTSLGMDWYATETESVGVEVSHVFFRSNTETTSVLFNGRIRF
jgi:hypothetical protein